MIPSIISLVGDLLRVVGKIFDWLYVRKMVDASKTADRLQGLQNQVEAAHEAVQRRIIVERAFADRPDRVRDDDGFRRADDE